MLVQSQVQEILIVARVCQRIIRRATVQLFNLHINHLQITGTKGQS